MAKFSKMQVMAAMKETAFAYSSLLIVVISLTKSSVSWLSGPTRLALR